VCIKIIGAVLMLIIFTSMVNRIVNTSRNERVSQQVYDTYPQMFDVCTLRQTVKQGYRAGHGRGIRVEG